jgi:response regulator RpfG family c-di-GMP phosphodiesterase
VKNYFCTEGLIIMEKGIILCVDDEKIVLNSIESQLSKHFKDKFEIELAESGEEGLEILDEVSEDGLTPLVIVSDWLMPDMKGDEFLVQAHKKFPKVVKVMLTGQADEDAVNRAKAEANLHKLIAKPWNVNELIDSIEDGLKEAGVEF